MSTAKQVKDQIAEKVSHHKSGISVYLGECDDDIERIEIRYPKQMDYFSLNPIRNILKESGFYVAQIIDFYFTLKRVILLIRDLDPKAKDQTKLDMTEKKPSYLCYRGAHQNRTDLQRYCEDPDGRCGCDCHNV